MYSDCLRTEELDDRQPVADPQPLVLQQSTTAKKRHVFGRSAGRIEPLRIAAVPELSQLFSELSKKERRSHGTLSSQNQSHEWLQSNNTIPETLNNSREWNMPCRMVGNHCVSQNDVRGTSESTPKIEHPGLKAPIMDKENFYTPRKNLEALATNTPANRCPLSALSVESASTKDTIDDVLSNTSMDSHQNILESGLEKKTNVSSYEGFRTPQCKLASSQQNPNFRQRMFGVSSTKMIPNIPLHPAVAAGQQQAKQLQLQRELQYPPSAIPSEISASRRFADSTPFKATPTPLGMRQTPARPVQAQAVAESQLSASDENLPSSGSWLPLSRPVETTPFKPISNCFKAAPGPASVRQSDSSAPSIESSTWRPHLKTGDPHPTVVEGAQPQGLQEEKPLGDLPSLKRKLESQYVAKPLPDQDQSSLLSPEPSPGTVKECKSQEGVKIAEPARIVSGVVVKIVESEALKTVDTEKKTCAVGSGQIAVNGHVYTILSLLGRGGSSKVFQVLDPENSQLKAVKCVNLAETDQSICEGYLNEIKLLADLQDSDCVIRMFDHEHQKENNILYVVMEKGDTDLSKLIKDVTKSKKMSAAMIVYYWIEMLNAVSFIHKRGTIHSDLKPANFLLVSGRLKLIDFGIASSIQEDMTSVVKESLTGTYNYISPEALCSTNPNDQRFKINYKSDVWSLGCILYNLVYGCTPFQHFSSQFQKLNAIVTSSYTIPFLEPPVEGCPSALIQAMKRCLVRNPKDRASVEELLQLPYLEQVGPERAIISQFASLAASVGIVQESEDNRYAVVIRAMQRLIMKNERHLPFLEKRK